MRLCDFLPPELRAEADQAARVGALDRLLAAALAARDEPLHAVDLGDGGGANLRYLAPRLGGRQLWRLRDSDAGRCAAGPGRIAAAMSRAGYSFAEDSGGLHLQGADLSLTAQIELADLESQPLPKDAAPDLVTGVALLERVDRDWMRALVRSCAAHRSHALFALSYDGRLTLTPETRHDGLIRELVNARLRAEGRPGPDAPVALAALFRNTGFDVEEARSDWHLDSAQSALYQRVHAALASLAADSAPGRADEIDSWLARRMDLLAAGLGALTVGHLDVLALAPDRR